jgi:hypothetical protein
MQNPHLLTPNYLHSKELVVNNSTVDAHKCHQVENRA